MKLRIRIMIALTRIGAEMQWTADRMGHLTTDPLCTNHDQPRPGSRLDIASRGLLCGECMADRAFGGAIEAFRTFGPDFGDKP